MASRNHMTKIEVKTPGLLTTVQDLGRPGFGPMGVSPSGAADALSLRLGNLLVGNAESTAGLEMTLLGGTFLFPDGGIAALTGSEFGATLDGAPIERWTLFRNQLWPNASPRSDPIGRAQLPLRARRYRREALPRQRFHPFAERPRADSMADH